jgi:Mycothiol maleylpyruvate isomerase N-terminal domain
MDRREELLRDDDRAWMELHDVLERLSAEDMTEPGLTEEWTVKDLLAHLGCWMAQAAHVLERIRLGTYERTEIDVDAMNRWFYEACRDLDLLAVKSGFQSSRVRMLQEWYQLPEVTPLADEWFRESGPEHIDEHMPDLERFVQTRR